MARLYSLVANMIKFGGEGYPSEQFNRVIVRSFNEKTINNIYTLISPRGSEYRTRSKVYFEREIYQVPYETVNRESPYIDIGGYSIPLISTDNYYGKGELEYFEVVSEEWLDFDPTKFIA